jgi:hypothetical protein
LVPIVTVQNRYNYADRSSEEVLRECEREAITFLPWYPEPKHCRASRERSSMPALARSWSRIGQCGEIGRIASITTCERTVTGQILKLGITGDPTSEWRGGVLN